MVPRMKFALTIVAAVFGGAFLAAPKIAKAPDPVRMVFIDLQKVRIKHKGQLAALDKLESEIKQTGESFQKRKNAVNKKAREDLQVFSPGTKEHDNLLLEIKLEKERIKLEQQMALAKFNDRQISLEEAFYAEVTAKVESFAKKNGYDVVELTRKVPRVKRETDLINLRNQWVIYHDPKLDVTDAFIEWINK